MIDHEPRPSHKHETARVGLNDKRYEQSSALLSAGLAGTFSFMKAAFTKLVIHEGDARGLSFIVSERVHLVCTSPPCTNLLEYPETAGQLGNIASYEMFLDELDKVWAECLRILVPGGRVASIVGDVCISRRKGGRHHVLPPTGDIQVRARPKGFDNLTPIRWLKVANIRMEASKSSRFLGKPNLPNDVVKNDVETVLFFRKPGGYRKPTGWIEFVGSEQKATTHLIERAANRLIRAGGRRKEADAAHLLGGVGVVVYKPNTATGQWHSLG